MERLALGSERSCIAFPQEGGATLHPDYNPSVHPFCKGGIKGGLNLKKNGSIGQN